MVAPRSNKIQQSQAVFIILENQVVWRRSILKIYYRNKEFKLSYKRQMNEKYYYNNYFILIYFPLFSSFWIHCWDKTWTSEPSNYIISVVVISGCRQDVCKSQFYSETWNISYCWYCSPLSFVDQQTSRSLHYCMVSTADCCMCWGFCL